MSRWLLLLLPACGFELRASGDAVPAPDVADTCRNGVVDPGEMCDDGGQVLGDGCDVRCQIDPGYVCPSAGSPCKKVVGLQTMDAETLPTAGGSLGGSPFKRDCPVNELIVGFEGWFANDNMSVGRTRSLCAPITFDSDGRAVWSTTHPSNYDANDNNGGFATHACASDEIAVGFTPNIRSAPFLFVAGWRLMCQPLTVQGGALQLGTVRTLDAHGPSTGTDAPTVRCAAGEGLGAHSGRAGATLDVLVLHCVALAGVTE